ncbi:hypothetical protein VFPFJ_00994 [Purpureocillium lilacinum]|uniref:Uncharacterized protein n=1 Tax=Purpureocillium lilacinum TaxID=33203 RepID=A0A179HBJ5_PURLI|nr:hypothetical protein VFPFJ_00994 [Purpureocillium lilacinum]OAQ86920.1 hypothetical protein VFPBJ_00960 [Purpureocillium lilacinum]OAQ94885.1 hypothetical protein VFPFJ_00994 [Purpureocillium lilacinum]
MHVVWRTANFSSLGSGVDEYLESPHLVVRPLGNTAVLDLLYRGLCGQCVESVPPRPWCQSLGILPY